MTAPLAPSRRTLALPLGMALASALAFLPDAAAVGAPAGVTTAQHQPATVGGTAAGQALAEGPTLSYVVNIGPGQGTAPAVRKAIADAGGTITMSYDQIGVIVVHSSNPDFAATIRKVHGVDSAGATRTAPLPAEATTDRGTPKALTKEQMKAAAAGASAGQDPLEPLQEKTLGSPKVTVGVIDTGVDDTHPDIAPNFDRAASVNCVSGKPDTTDGAWRPNPGESPHGTHVAGEIAAAKNGIGVVGVAPGVKVAGIKVATPDGLFYTEAVVCGFVWAAEHGVDVTNNSYYTDPWYFNCVNDPDQKALVDSITRATRYAEKKGTVNVAAAGNNSYDLATHQITDPSSPDDTPPIPRTIDPSVCKDLPTQLPGVVTVAATGAKGLKSSYSNYGLGTIDIAAPGGDSTALQPPAPPATSGSILGPLPGGTWGYMSGTSMATPHVVGVAALIKSTHPNATAAEVKEMLYHGADATACPEPYDFNGDGKDDAVCASGQGHTGFYGVGIADALNAVR
jgi:subtilisin family serine protease